jgi:beta-lactamase class A
MKKGSGPASYFVIGESRTNADNAITHIFGSFYLALEIDGATEEILAFNCTHTLELTEVFLRRLFVGRNVYEVDEGLETTLRQCYGGSSRRAVLTSFRDALKRYRAIREEDPSSKNS